MTGEPLTSLVSEGGDVPVKVFRVIDTITTKIVLETPQWSYFVKAAKQVVSVSPDHRRCEIVTMTNEILDLKNKPIYSESGSLTTTQDPVKVRKCAGGFIITPVKS